MPEREALAPAPADLTPVPYTPREPVPDVITSAAALWDYAEQLRSASGPLALDAERASGFKYSQRAYLVQLRRSGAGTALIDPIWLPDLSIIQEATDGVEWILHAATQDLACLAEVGLHPARLFDTELAGRLLGRERVSLGPLVASELGEHLEKGHGAADWSLRPLTSGQLLYAVLDVELLVELRDVMYAELERAGKLTWALQEFEALLTFTPRDRGDDPWRRTSGIHKIRKPRALAVVRALWLARDGVAQREDIAPGRILSDAAIAAAATLLPATPDALGAIKEFSGRGQTRRRATWWTAISTALALPEAELPAGSLPASGPPAPRAWAERDPLAFARLETARAQLKEISERVLVPVENLISPQLVRRICWTPPTAPHHLTDQLSAGGARPWQIELTGPALEYAMSATVKTNVTSG
ncbi:MAG: HRDC domain-containing protein [Actinomycetota bacterium]|nr:HRDC domain-containing protein [Actinomycetota bacterium]